MWGFGYYWRVRSGLEGGKIGYQPTGVAVGAKRIVLDASKGSVGIQLADDLGWGTYAVTFDARLDGFDPLLVATAWLHDDHETADSMEIDWEHRMDGDPNNPYRHVLGILRGHAIPEGEVVRSEATAFITYRVSVTATPYWQSVKVEGYRAGEWVVITFKRWDVTSPRAGQFKVALWWQPGAGYLKKWCVAPTLTITDFTFIRQNTLGG